MKSTSKPKKIKLNKFNTPFVPKSKTALRQFIRTASRKELKTVGFGILTNYTEEKGMPDNYLKPGQIHFLIPGKCFDFIPEGMPIINLSGTKERFSKKRFHKDDLAYGMLPCGFIR